jgi:ATP-binding cassette, subfamily C (CFTR/MRP), member 1
VYWTTAENPQGLSISQAFTSLAIVALVSEPRSYLVQIRAMFNSSLACFQRIQDFLVIAENQNLPHLLAEGSLQEIGNTGISPDGEQDGQAAAMARGEEQHELSGFVRRPLHPAEDKEYGMIVTMADATFQTRDGIELLKHIDFEVTASTIHAVIGPVGSGKTSLLLAMLGELNLKDGSCTSWGSACAVSFCSQTPWLRNVSIRENIVAGARFEFDAEWYRRVVSACGLDRDFPFDEPGWDLDLIGSQGLSLSGGQKRRVVRRTLPHAPLGKWRYEFVNPPMKKYRHWPGQSIPDSAFCS